MHALILQADLLPEAQLRVEEADIARTLVLATGISDLNHENHGEVLMVPFPVLKDPKWPSLRVRLVQANRMFIVVGHRLNTENVMLAARDGAFDVLDVKDSKTRWQKSIERAAQSQELWLSLYGAAQSVNIQGLIGESGAMKSLREAIERLGVTDVSVLVVGESGAGKERIASAQHDARGRGPFVPINCAAIPKDLMEAELFGAEKGAFTGSVKTRVGLVEQANGGTLFLDEIGEMDIALQPKLLRFLETKRARRVGGEMDYEVNLRVVSATNRNMDQAIEEGVFRADLYCRLSEVTLNAPPLRARIDDVPLLVRKFVDNANERFGKNIEAAEPELIRKLQGYGWPGNVLELKSVVDRLVLLYDGPLLREGFWQKPDCGMTTMITRAMNMPEPRVEAGPAPVAAAVPPRAERGYRLPSKAERMEMAREMLRDGRLSLIEVAASVGVHPTTLFRWRKMGKV